MCDCISKTTEQTGKEVRRKIEEKWTVAEYKDKGSYSNIGFAIDGNKMVTVLTIPFEVRYVKKRTNGEPEKRESKQTINVIPSYCPFCGKKIEFKQS